MRRRTALVIWTSLSLASISIFFQNCSKLQPELNASSNYTVGFESAADSSGGSLTNAQIDQLRASTVSIALPIGSTANTNNLVSPEFTFSMLDRTLMAAVSFSCNLDNTHWVNCSNPYRIEGLGDGMHVLAVRAMYQGVPSLVKEFSWVRDTEAPNLVFNRVPPSLIGTPNVDISFTASDRSGIVSYQCNLDQGGWKSCSNSVSLTDLTMGDHSFEVQATDLAGNKNEILKNWKYDPSFPFLELSKKPDAFTSDSIATFEFNSSIQGFDRFECQFRMANDFEECASGIRYVLAVDGIHTFNVRAKNSEGYYTSILSYSFTRDTQAPIISLISPADGSQITDSLIISVSISDGSFGSGVNKVSCVIETAINGQEEILKIDDCTFPLNINKPNAGLYKLKVVAIDNVGNVSTSPYFAFQHLGQPATPPVDPAVE